MVDVADEFLRAARAFRDTLARDDLPQSEFARHVRNALARVYLSAALLGPPGAVEQSDPNDATFHRPQSDALRADLSARFGEHDTFVDVSDPSRLVDEDATPIVRSLAGELVEIDGDLADAIERLEHDRPDALWDVRWAVENHWGQHALACLRPLHQMAVYGVV